MEDTLREDTATLELLKKGVLILVLMEDTLRAARTLQFLRTLPQS